MKRVPGSANFRRQAMVALRSVAAATALLYLAGCASGLRAPGSLPPPPSSASRPGPWETSYAVYDPALFGPELPLTGLVEQHRLKLKNGKLKKARLLIIKSQRRLELWVGKRWLRPTESSSGKTRSGRKSGRVICEPLRANILSASTGHQPTTAV